MDQQTAVQFLEEYHTTFSSLDPVAITALFAFPCQVVGDTGTVALTSVPGPEVWAAAIERIVGAYRVLGVTTATPEGVQVVPVTAGTALVALTWHLEDAEGRPVYSFAACYTLVDTDAGPRIAAVVHDETPRLQQAVAAVTQRHKP
ncbi:MAG: hypothetical protein LCH96_10145 [Actinobacteria bacterium]|nr:hypothetical protein [Actinomycetota bacterium]